MRNGVVVGGCLLMLACGTGGGAVDVEGGGTAPEDIASGDPDAARDRDPSVDDDVRPDGTGGADSTDAIAEDPLEERDGASDAAELPGGDTDTTGELPGEDADPPWPVYAPAPIEPLVACAPPDDACAPGATSRTIFASYRKDHYYPDEVYPEYTDPPLDGGRFHIVGVAAASGAVTGVRVDEVALSTRVLPPAPSAEWWHVWPDPAVEGEPVWAAFHSRSRDWDARTSGTIQIATEGGVALDGVFSYDAAAAPVTWVTTAGDATTRLVYVENTGTSPLAVSRVWIDGSDATARTCGPSTIPAGATAMLRVAQCVAPTRGDAWTVVVEYEDAPPSVGAGRHLDPWFVIEAWPVSADCALPLPDGPSEALARHLRAGFDTLHLYWGGGPPRCETATPDVVTRLLPAAEYDLRVLLGDDFPLFDADPRALLPDTARVAGFLTGDESDGEFYDDDGAPRAEGKAARARRSWRVFPEVAVYNGGMTNGHVGAFAGMTDVQGMDVYTAACAPHITRDGAFPPLRGPFDYLRNTRNNHMPWPTWLYAQGLHGGWNLGSSEEPIHRQPDRQELLVQALSVAAAGGKGLMWFQTSLSEADHDPRRWAAIGEANRLTRAVRRWLHEGDVLAPAPRVRGDAIVEAIVGPDAIVVPVINLASTEAVTDDECFLRSITDPAHPPHWILADQRISMAVSVPPTSQVHDVFEVLPSGETADVEFGVHSGARELVIPDIDLSNDVPVRLFVLHARASGRDEAARAAASWGAEDP